MANKIELIMLEKAQEMLKVANETGDKPAVEDINRMIDHLCNGDQQRQCELHIFGHDRTWFNTLTNCLFLSAFTASCITLVMIHVELLPLFGITAHDFSVRCSQLTAVLWALFCVIWVAYYREPLDVPPSIRVPIVLSVVVLMFTVAYGVYNIIPI
jgi:hypothetical protein